MKALQNKQCTTVDTARSQRMPGKRSGKKKCGQQVSDTAGRRWRWQHKTELDGDKRSVAKLH